MLESTYDKRVCELFLPMQRAWDVSKIERLCCLRDMELILKIPISWRVTEDNWMWTFDKLGRYFLRSGY